MAVGQLNAKEGTREVYFEFNGMPRSVKINDRTAQSTKVVRAKAAEVPGGVGAADAGRRRRDQGEDRRPRRAGHADARAVGDEDGDDRRRAGPGRVDSISVKSGDDVEAGDVLITLG